MNFFEKSSSGYHEGYEWLIQSSFKVTFGQMFVKVLQLLDSKGYCFQVPKVCCYKIFKIMVNPMKNSFTTKQAALETL